MALNTPDSRRSVMFVLPTLRGGGAERVVLTLLRHIDRQRFRPILAVVDMRDATYSADVPIDIEVVDLCSSRVLLSLPRLLHLTWSRRPDVVFSTLSHLNLALAILLPLLPRPTRYVARETSVVSQVVAGSSQSGLWTWAYRRFYHRFNLVICQSRYMRADLVDRFSFPAEKSIVINNPVDTQRIDELSVRASARVKRERTDSSDFINLLAVGRLSPEKGFDLLIEALAQCQPRKFCLTILGDGPMRSELEAFAIARGVGDRIIFEGFQNNPYPYYRSADALVLSSHFEGFPNAVLEALACGTPVIATPAIGGTTEILERVEGCLVASEISAKSLAQEIVRFKKGTRIPSSAVAPYKVSEIVRQYEAVFA